MSSRTGTVTGVSWKADGKDVEKADCPRRESEGIDVGGGYFSCSPFVLFDYPTNW